MTKKRHNHRGNNTVTIPAKTFERLVSHAGRGAGASAVTLMVANPLVTIIAIVVAFVLILVIGSFALTDFILNITNIWLWIAAFLLSIAIRPKSSLAIIGSAILIGGGFWIYKLWLEFQALQAMCNIPIIGGLLCGGWNFLTFIPRIFNLIMLILTVFIMVTLISMLYYQIIGKGKRR